MPFKNVSRRKNLFVAGLLWCSALVWFLQLPARADQSVTLNWNPSVATNVAGYKIYFGTASLDYTNSVVVGNATNATISGLVAGRTYYFAATTYDDVGDESDYSGEASYTVPMPVPTTTLGSATSSGGQFSFNVSDASGSQYVVQASTDLINWVALQTNTAPFTFVDTNAASFQNRFYRTCLVSQ